MNGVSNDKFNPSEKATRAMIITILHNKDGNPAVTPSAKFKDVAKGAWYESAIAWGQANKIMNGLGNDIFAPGDAITREQMAVVLYNYAKSKGNVSGLSGELSFADKDKVHTWAQEAIKWCVSNKIINGKEKNKLDPQGFATRAEVATMIMNFCEKE